MKFWYGRNIDVKWGLLVQMVFWITILIALPLGWKTNWPEQFWVKQGVIIVLLMGLYYLNSQYFVPKLLLRNNILAFFIAVLFCVIASLAIIQVVETWLNLPELIHKSFNPDRPFRHKERSFRFDYFLFLLTLLVFGISTSVALINNRNKENDVRQAFEKQKISTELETLKSQINPHFYFNTLNSIYALAAIDASLTRKAIHMLSKMMRYVLYESHKAKVLLSQEVSFIDNYIELMRLRITEKVQVILVKPEPVREDFIAPMLFMPFVENAFKHGINPVGNCQIKIVITQKDNEISLLVENGIYENEGMDIEEDKGIGLTNTKRRLELLYPINHQLKISNDKDLHTVTLRLTNIPTS